MNKWNLISIGNEPLNTAFWRFVDKTKYYIDSSLIDGVCLGNETMFKSHAIIFPMQIVGIQMRECVHAAKVE